MGNIGELARGKVLKMMRQALYVIVASLALVGVAVRGEALLGCEGTPGEPGSFATCDMAADCAPVAGVDCTTGICFCTFGSDSPFCACAVAAPAPAPALSTIGLTALAAVLGLIGLFSVWRRTNRRRDAV